MEDFNIEFGSEETQDVADPALEGVEDQDVAAPEQPEADEGEKEVEVADQPQQRKTETDAAFAALRRRAEAEASAKYQAEMQAVKERAEQAELFAKSRGFASFDEMQKAGYREALADGATPEVLESFVQQVVAQMLKDSPAIKQAEEMKSRMEADEQIAEFNREYPDAQIKDVGDIFGLPNSEQIYEYVARGVRLADAYMLANKDTVLSKQREAAKQKTINDIKSKDHLKTQSGAGGGDDVVVPEDTYLEYKMFMPEWSDKQIREHYKRTKE